MKMLNENQTEQTPVQDPVQQPDVQNNEQQPAPENDLMSRVAQFQTENKPKVDVPENFNFDVNEINNIEDPNARRLVEDAYKSFQKGFNHKFQEIADLRKQMESQLHKEGWTPERVQALTQDPEFLKAAQEVAGMQTQETDDDEYLSDTERQLMAKVGELEGKLNQFQSNQSQQQIEQEHDRLARIYGENYNRQAVDTIITDLKTGKVKGGPEAVWKVYDYEKAIERAYNMGLNDRKAGVQEKVQASSFEGNQVTPNQIPAKEENENPKQFWRKLMGQTLAESQQGAQIKQ